MSKSLSGPAKDTAAGDIVSISVTPDGPYGVLLEGDRDGNAAVIKAFERLKNGKFGPLQKHGGLHAGDVLYQINDNRLDVVPFDDVLATVKDRNLIRKTFKFMNATEYYKKKEAQNAPKLAGLAISSEKGNAFMSTIRQTRLSLDPKGNQFCEYEVACQYRVVSRRVQKELVYRWSVWRRYSEFETLNKSISTTLGWQMDGIEFPPANTFVWNKVAHDFIEKRREDLNIYWQKVINVNNGQVVEFQKHHCQDDLKAFLEVDNALSGEIGQAPDVVGTGSAPPSDSGSNNRSSRRMSSKGGGRAARPSSVRSSGTFAFNDSAPGAAPAPGNPPTSSAASSSSRPASTNQSSTPTAPPAPAPSAGLRDDLIKFKKMLDVGLPMPVVRNKMAMEGFSDADMTLVENSNGGSGGSGAPPPPLEPAAKAAPPAPAAKVSAPVPPPSGEVKIPPKATGARASLLGDIAKRRIE